MKSFNLKIVSPTMSYVDDTIEEIMLGGSEGFFTIFADHSNFVARLFNSAGYYVKDGKKTFFSLRSGFCTVEKKEINEVVVITTSFKEENFKTAQEVYDLTYEFGNMTKEEVNDYFKSSNN